MAFQTKPTLKTSTADPAAADVELQGGSPDSTSSLSFSPVADYLALGSWDNNVRIYEVEENLAGDSITAVNPVGRAAYSHNAPVLDVCWSQDGRTLLSGGTDGAARAYDLEKQAASQVAGHEAPIRCVQWLSQPGMLVTGSWDKTIKYWDMRSSTPAATVQLEERCYAMDLCGQLLVAGTAERKIQIYDTRNPTVQFAPTIESPLKYQTRSIACFPDQTGYAIGSIEGRVAIQYIDDKRAKKENFSFKCHRANEAKPGMPLDDTKAQLFAVNAISFHPSHGTFSTAGSDGTISFWDKTNKTRLKSFNLKESNPNAEPLPVSATAFSRTKGCQLFAYAISYDWAHGYRGNTPGHPNKVKLHICKDDEVKPRPKN